MKRITLLFVLIAIAIANVSAANGDRWEAVGVIDGEGNELSCTFRVVSEDDGTVKFVQTPGRLDTFTGTTASYVTMLDEVEHDGKKYTVVEIGDSAFFSLAKIREVRHMSAGVKKSASALFAIVMYWNLSTCPKDLRKSAKVLSRAARI